MYGWFALGWAEGSGNIELNRWAFRAKLAEISVDDEDDDWRVRLVTWIAKELGL